MSRYIDADALKKALCKVCGMRHYCKSHDDDCWAKRRIDETPTVDAVPVVHSSWSVFAEMDLREGRTGKHILVCRECGHTEKIHHSDKMPNYCQNCGARMKGEQE